MIKKNPAQYGYNLHFIKAVNCVERVAKAHGHLTTTFSIEVRTITVGS